MRVRLGCASAAGRRRWPVRLRRPAVVSTGLVVWTSLLVAGGTPASAVVSDIPFPKLSSSAALGWVAGLALFLALLWFVPILYDNRQANRWRAVRQAQLIDKMVDAAAREGHGLSVEEVRQLVSAMDRPPRGASGLTSSLLALLIVFLVGIALFASLLSSGSDSGDLRKTIITSLLAVLASISGFYFGARTAQTSTEQATKPPESRPSPASNHPRPAGDGKPDGSSRGGADQEPATDRHDVPAGTDDAVSAPPDGDDDGPTSGSAVPGSI
jgi:acid phosphatase family membrane protein YuiD